MALTREKKGVILTNFKDILSRVSTAVFVTFKGLSVGEATELRKALKKEGIAYKVAKKTLLGKALEGSTFEGTVPALDGEIAFAYPESADDADVTAAARGIYAFEKKLEGKLGIVGGIFNKMFKDKAGMLEIATIPSQHTLRGMFVNVINAPIQGFVVALSAIAGKKTE